MLALTLCAALLAQVTTGTADARPSLVVVGIRAKAGVQPDIAEVLAGTLTVRVRAAGQFSRVMGQDDVERVIGLEKQKQLLNCDTTSCMAELAGALGADFLMGGDVAKLGNTWLLNLSLQDARTSQVVGSATESLPNADEGMLLAALDRMIPVVLARRTSAATVDAQRAPREGHSPSSPAPRIVLGVGAAGVVLGLLAGVLGAAAALGATGVFIAANNGAFVKLGVGLPLTIGILGGWAGGAIIVLTGLVLVVTGLGAAAAGVVLQ